MSTTTTVESWERLQSTLDELAPGLGQDSPSRDPQTIVAARAEAAAAGPPPPTSREHQNVLDMLPKARVLTVMSPRGASFEVLTAPRVAVEFSMLRSIDDLDWPQSRVPFAKSGRDLLVVDVGTQAIVELQTDTGCSWPAAHSLRHFFEWHNEQLLCGEIAVVDQRDGEYSQIELTPWSNLANAWDDMDTGETVILDGPAWDRLSRAGDALFRAAVEESIFPTADGLARATIQGFGLLAIAEPSRREGFLLDVLDLVDADPALPDASAVDEVALMKLASTAAS